MTAPQPRALVLGGTGYLGRRLCTALDAAGWSVLAVGRRSVPVTAARLLVADLTSADISDVLAEAQPSLVVNAAGGVWQLSERELIDSNAVLVDRLVAALAKHPRAVRLIQLGSAKEYGTGPAGVAIAEDAVARPVSTYGRSKLSATRAVLAATRRGELDGVILRLPTTIGPGSPQVSLLGTVSAALAAAVRENRPAVLRLFRLTAHQDFVALDDLARGVLAAAQSRQAVGRIINLGYGEAIPVRSLVETLVAVSGWPTEIRDDAPPSGTDRIEWQRLDISAAAELLGWTPRQQLRDALIEVWSAVNPQRDADAGVAPDSADRRPTHSK
ncbi:NAD-dependent epimerase/dehydratase family protein [Streptomyces sp. NPDC020800]|uniref:NAD-dependent epimerase/dehydratase family protein n=1 Tax=Streptomyces sp. NPDC020800 TaxID=3365092 RepID=UPI0037BDA7D8